MRVTDSTAEEAQHVRVLLPSCNVPVRWIEVIGDAVVLCLLFVVPLVWLRRNTTRYKRVVW